jgi:TRAP-type C4-dicarboxylate transport system permease small subunit
MDPGRDSPAFLDRLIAPALGIAAAAVLFCLMILTCVDVVGRYFFNSPVHGGFELTEMLLATLIFCALPIVTLRAEHVSVDRLDPITPERLARVQHVVSCLMSFVATCYLSWRLWIRAIGLDAAGETTAQLKFKLAYLTYAMSALMALTALAPLFCAFRRPRRHHTGEV